MTSALPLYSLPSGGRPRILRAFLFSAMELETAVRLKSNLVHLVWIDGFYDMVGIQEMAKFGTLSGVTFHQNCSHNETESSHC
jgi:thiamine pyrophosphate-dependent acetolactate synthase large subunit-like protein